MNPTRRSALLATLGALGTLTRTAWANDSAYPARPIRLVVPFPAGGGTDIIARTVARQLSETLGWSLVVDNRPGAGGNLGVDLVAKAAPDGYTLVLGQTSNLAINPTLYRKLPYDPRKDLAPVVLAVSAPLVLVVRAGSPIRSLADLLEQARRSPGKLVFGTPGNGTVAHLSAELLQKSAGIRMQHIPYKGASQALTDLMGGQLDLYLSSVPTALNQLKAGQLRALGVTSRQRTGQLPQVPTLAESGQKGLEGFDTSTWFGFLAPAGTPPERLSTLNKAVNQALLSPRVRERLQAEGGDVVGGSASEFADLLHQDLGRWAQVVHDSGAQID